MDIVLRYWDPKTCQVKVRYFDSQFLEHARAIDLMLHFNESFKDLDQGKLIQISMDGPSVNKSFLKQVKSDRAKNVMNGIVDIGTCNLHNMHGAFKNGAEYTGWQIKETLKAASRY